LKKSHYLVRISLIAALYVTINIVFAPISYGPIQVRLAEALSVMPFVDPAAIGGLFIGCVISNFWGGLGIIDVIGGSFFTLIAAIITYKMKKPVYAPIPPIIINAFGISLYLHLIFNIPYWLTLLYISIGQIVACFLIGYPLLLVLLKRKIWIFR